MGFGVAFATTGAVLGLSAGSREEDIDKLIEFRDAEACETTIKRGAEVVVCFDDDDTRTVW